MGKVYKKRELNFRHSPPIQETAKIDSREFRRGNSMIIYTPDFEPFEAVIDEPLQRGGNGIVYLSFRPLVIADFAAWVSIRIAPKISIASIGHLEHSFLRIHFPISRLKKDKHQFDMVDYSNVTVTESEARVSSVKTEVFKQILERKVFNPRQLEIFT